MKTRITWFDRMMMAATFAEANEHEVARTIVRERDTATATKSALVGQARETSASELSPARS